MKYTFRAGHVFLSDSGSVTPYICTQYRFGIGSEDVAQARLFDSQGEALVAFAEWHRAFGGSCGRVELVAVEEIPGETKREVVELTGVVDFDSLAGFAVQYLELGTFLGRYPHGSKWLHRASPLNHGDIVIGSLHDIIRIRDEARESWGDSFGAVNGRIVGIRETTTKPTLKVRSLDSTYAYATD